MIKKFLLPICLLAALGCSDEDSTTSSSETTNAVTESYSTITTKANKVTQLQPQASSLALPLAAPNLGSDWTTSTDPFRDEQQDPSPTTSPKEWMGIQLNADAVRENGSSISPFGRLADALQIFCALGVALDSSMLDENEYPKNGTGLSQTITASTATKIESQCDMNDTSNIVNETITIDVTTPSSTAIYAKKIVMTMPSSMGGGSQTYYIKSDDSEVNVATTEVNSNGVHRTVVAYDKSTKILKMEYISAPDTASVGSGEHVAAYRLYTDEANDIGYLMVLEQ